jgi:ATP-dependent exoDNAse (exonuclease V) beta subunit
MSAAGKLLRYSASAGSGKTHALTGFYLSRILTDPGAYRRILAVTFTNSAAAEMKSRILTRLGTLGSDNAGDEAERNEFVEYLCEYFPDMYPDPVQAMLTVRKNAPQALKKILQDYSRFTVGTIDSFFQRVIRAFAREIEVPAGYEVELEHEALLSDAVDGLLAEVATDPRLRRWISSYVASRLDDNKGWDVRREIMEVAEQIFGENFRQLSPADKKTISNYEILNDYTEKVFRIKKGFESELRSLAARGVAIYEGCGMTPDDFLSKARGGVGEMLRKYADGVVKTPGSTWEKAAGEAKYLTGGAPQHVVKAFQEALSKGLGDVVTAISSMFENRYQLYISAIEQVRTIHIMGILGAISERVRTLAQDENIFLLSDSGELINRLIADDDTPFIYEKIGTAYDHYVIDEFQDTSQIQWNNFRPLISETLARGKDNLVVGDVKQSIYRWRNSDWRIIHSEVNRTFGDDTVRTIPLSKNYRSRKNIIRFNNLMFAPAAMPSICDSKLNSERIKVSDIYSGSVQEGTDSKPGGFIKVSLYRKSEDEGWRDKVLNDIPSLVEELQDHGYKASDILFLCRTNEEGKSIISSILEHSALCPPEKLARYNFEVTSGESLYLERNPAVTLLLSCLRYLVDPGSRLNRSLMVRSFILATEGKEELVYAADSKVVTDNPLPEGWEDALVGFRNASLFSATEDMIRYFSLGSHRENVAYLSSFQDLVLQYSGRYSSDISSFVSWWESDGYKSTIGQSDCQEAIRVMTVHKAKGLQSSVVIIPFVSWDFLKRGYSRPLLWVSNVPDAFAPMPVVLPELTSRLDNSLFADQAKMERASKWVDGVNLLYVAFTRAIDALYIMAPEILRTPAGGGNAESLLNEALRGLPEDFVWQENDALRHFDYGELPAVPATREEDAMIMEEYIVSELRGTMKLRTGGALPLDEMKVAEPGGRAYGIMMHELLSRVTTTSDIDNAISHVCDNGLLPLSQKDLMTSRVRTMLYSDNVREWFDGSSAVKTEATIILPSGAARRPDRVMMKGNSVTVVDYKFGEPSARHRSQAAGYRELLGQMGYENVKSWLWYVEKDIIEEV